MSKPPHGGFSLGEHGWRFVHINGVDCRMVEDMLRDMVIDDPNCITHR